MFQRILAPVDLEHLDKLARALAVTAETARQHGAPVIYVSVTGAAPSKLAHTPEEFRRKLEAFAQDQAQRHGIDATAHAIISHDPAVDTDRSLMQAADTLGADLIVMATHPPRGADYFWSGHGGTVAGHARASVMLVRDP